jgi:hypothetical protein
MRPWRRSSSASTSWTPPGFASASSARSFAFVGNAEPHDDMTMIVLKIGGVETARVQAQPAYDSAPVSPR